MRNRRVKSISTFEELQLEKERLRGNVQRSKNAFLEKASIPSLKRTIGISLGGLALTGLVTYGLKNWVFKSKKHVTRPRKTVYSRQEDAEDSGTVSNLARYAFLMPVLQTGVEFLLKRLEDRLKHPHPKG